MNATIVYTAFFLSFALCIWAAAWVISQGLSGWGWILFIVILFYGNVSIQQGDVVECPKCGHTFDAKVAKSDN